MFLSTGTAADGGRTDVFVATDGIADFRAEIGAETLPVQRQRGDGLRPSADRSPLGCGPRLGRRQSDDFLDRCRVGCHQQGLLERNATAYGHRR